MIGISLGVNRLGGNRSAIAQASALNDTGVTFTRATAAVDPTTGAAVASGARRRLPLSVLGRTLQADLIEPARTNLLLNSRVLTGANWIRGGTDAGTTATKLVENLDTGTVHYLAQLPAGTADNTVYTWSAVVTPAEIDELLLYIGDRAGGNRGCTFTLTGAGSFTAPTGSDVARITRLSGGAYRVSYSLNLGTGASAPQFSPHLFDTSRGGVVYDGDGTSGLFITDLQLEAGAWPTSPIITTAAAVTRNADVLTATASAISAVRGTFLAILLPMGWTQIQDWSDAAQRWFAMEADATTTKIRGTDNGAGPVTAGDGDASTTLTNGLADHVLSTVAVVYDATSLRGYAAGVPDGTPDAAPNVYDTLASMSIGASHAGLEAFSGYVAILWIPRACTDQEIADLHASVAANSPTFVN